MNTSPVVGNGLVYVGGSGDPGLVHAIEIESGEQQWEFEPAGYLSSAPALVDGTLYFGTWGKQFYALDAESGDVLWNTEVGHRFGSSSPAVVDGSVYVGSYGDGPLVVSGSEDEEEFEAPAMFALDAESGEIQWRYDQFGDRSQIGSSPAVADGRVYFSAEETLYALASETGDEVWTRNVPSHPDASRHGCSPPMATTVPNAGDGPTTAGCRSLVADDTGAVRYVTNARVCWLVLDGSEAHTEYYYADRGSFDRLDSIAAIDASDDAELSYAADRATDHASVITGNAWEGSETNDARLLVVDRDGGVLLNRAVGFANTTNVGRDAVGTADGYLLSGTAVVGDGSLPWLAWFDTDGECQRHRFPVRAPHAAPDLLSTDGAAPQGYPREGHLGDVDCLRPTDDGLFVVYNERDRSGALDLRQPWLGYVEGAH
ncbi:outer membrane protein assembly factor BamB family protein [Haloarchaeobius iranensis]|uniref:PQQ-like domain-containing protein n=2 Tax=Haloarchaeobius iranensis TaxID=996166 RepID=A0A1H0BNR7_9EURY|nr:PQQ-like domain-containing protein [Haloarchaeobius iranensis]